MSNGGNDAVAPNAQRLLWAGFMAILAAGIGFSIRGGFLDNWRAEYGFTAKEVGDINGIGFTGFCFGIIVGGIICDKIGYGKLVIAAFGLHVLSAVVTFAPTTEMSKEVVGQLLTWGSFLFALANGVLEAVANPLVATVFAKNRTHYLNILHASWPAGLVLGSASGWVLDDIFHVHWKLQFALFLIPTVLYGLMFLGQHFPKSEASEKGLSFGEMFKDVGIMGGVVVCAFLGLFFSNALGLESGVAYALAGGLLVMLLMVAHTHGARGETLLPLGAFLLLTLFVTHAMVGAVELGTDSWIQNITGNILTSQEGKWLFVFTSMLMFGLRFCADFIEKKIGLSPVGILLVCAVLGCVGLNLASGIVTFGGALVALTVYGIGKTFFWPTMLAVASDRFPRTGALAISIMGGVGMMSAGLIGAPGLGYSKDRFAGEALKATDEAAFEKYKADKPSKFLIFKDATGLDGKKLGEIQKKLDDARSILEKGKVEDLKAEAMAKLSEKDQKAAKDEHANLLKLAAQLKEAGVLKEGAPGDPKAADTILTPVEKQVQAASIQGDRNTLVADSVIPATMAVIYLLLLIYFKSIGGYKAVKIESGTALGTAES
jgi:MFS family permease